MQLALPNSRASMDIFSYHNHPQFWFHDVPESSSTSDPGSAQHANFSDEEVLLASRNPKKRAGRKKFRETRHPVYRGVRRRNSGKWVCEVREPNKKSRIWLGTFPTAEMAARAHDVAALALRGRSACLNFADSAWRLPVPVSGEAKDIQKAAAEAAEAFRQIDPSEENGVSSEQAAENVLYMDEEAVFGMPGLLANMAEGMMLQPPLYPSEENAVSSEQAAENVFYMDEEAVFGMPGLLANMAEGMMLPPPLFVGGDYSRECDDVGTGDIMSLWSYSI